MNSRLPMLLALAGAAAQVPAMACSSCGCTLTSDWETLGVSSHQGFRLDLRYDYVNQRQMRHGTSKSSSADAVEIGDLEEAEQYTKNNYYTLAADYAFNRDWGVSVVVPWVDRKHSTLPGGVAPADTSSDSSLGDMKLIGRYQGFDVGLMFGLKLPTGKTDVTFASGDSLDASLQPGTGGTDAILGVYKFGAINKDWDWYAQALGQMALSKKNGYRPGNGLNLNAGVRYMVGDWAPQVQINFRTVRSDKQDGVADGNTGGQLLYLSPGVTYSISKSSRIYAFMQLPLYQNAKGYQLAPLWNASVGVNVGF